jgi:hypothetical protein
MKSDVENVPSYHMQIAQLVIKHEAQVDHWPDALNNVDEVIHGHLFNHMIFFDRCGIVKMKARRKGIGIRYQDDYRNDAKRNGIKPIAVV